jgi:ABC-type uncharacterized transport system involved in gliding motility auxiliary subunit
MKLRSLYTATSILILCAALISLNFIAGRINVKLDLTRNNLYTLSPGTRAIIAGIEDEAVVQYFFSRSSETLPVMLKDYGQRVQELLVECSELSPRLRLEVYDPRPDSDAEEMAVRYGIHGAQTADGSSFFMGAALQFHDVTVAIPFFDPRREMFLEYDIASLLARTRETGGRKVLGLLSGMALKAQGYTQPLMMQTASPEDWLFVQELERSFETKDLSVATEEIPDDIDLLLVLHPMAVSGATEYAIEQYILRGGKAAVMVDPAARSVPDTSQAAQYGGNPASRSNLPNLFKTLGVEYDDQLVAADRRYATRVSSRSGPVQYPFWLSLDTSSFNREQIITSQLESMLLIESGFFKPLSNAAIEFTPLITTSDTPGTIRAAQLAMVTPQTADRYQPASGPLSLAALTTGRFVSSFDGRPEGSSYTREHLAQAGSANTVLLIGDIDCINNSYALRRLNFMGQSILEPLNHNIAFLTNALEFITGSTELISIRSRGTFQRPFERVAEIEKQAQAKWHSVEQELTDKIQELQRTLNEVQRARSQDNQLLISREQQAKIDRFKIEQLEFKRKRREVRKNLRQDIERLGTILTVLNITVIPSLVLLAGLYIYLRRSGGRPLLGKRRGA